MDKVLNLRLLNWQNFALVAFSVATLVLFTHAVVSFKKSGIGWTENK